MNRRVLLIVDDEKEIRDLLVEEFSDLGIRCISASNTQEAIDVVNASHPDAILSDMEMPEADGLELLSYVRRSGCEVPLLFLTAHGDARMKACAVLLGANQFHVKPYDRSLIRDAVIKALDEGARLNKQRAVADRTNLRAA